MSKPLRVPEVGEFVRHIGTLIGIEEVPPPPPPPPTLSYIFESKTYGIDIRVAGKIIANGPSFIPGVELPFVINEATRIAKEYDYEADVVIVEYTERRRHHAQHAMENIYQPGTVDFSSEPNSQRGMPNDTETVVWSSKLSLKKEDAE